MLEKLLNSIKDKQYPIYLALCVILVAFISYNLGQIDRGEADIKINSNAGIYKAVFTAEPPLYTPVEKPRDIRVVVSKSSSSKKYHFTWCPGAKQIKEENKIWFASEAAAQQAGYTLAGNCSK